MITISKVMHSRWLTKLPSVKSTLLLAQTMIKNSVPSDWPRAEASQPAHLSGSTCPTSDTVLSALFGQLCVCANSLLPRNIYEGNASTSSILKRRTPSPEGLGNLPKVSQHESCPSESRHIAPATTSYTSQLQGICWECIAGANLSDLATYQ